MNKSTKIIAILVIIALFITSLVLWIKISKMEQERNISLLMSKDEQRAKYAYDILFAFVQYYQDHGVLPPGTNTSSTEICISDTSNCSGLLDLGVLSKNSKYIQSIPLDPDCPELCSINGTGFRVEGSSSKITIRAPNAVRAPIIVSWPL